MTAHASFHAVLFIIRLSFCKGLWLFARATRRKDCPSMLTMLGEGVAQGKELALLLAIGASVIKFWGNGNSNTTNDKGD